MGEGLNQITFGAMSGEDIEGSWKKTLCGERSPERKTKPRVKFLFEVSKNSLRVINVDVNDTSERHNHLFPAAVVATDESGLF